MKASSNTVRELQTGVLCSEAVDVLLLLMPRQRRMQQGIRLVVGLADGALQVAAVTCRTPCILLLQQLLFAAPLPTMCSLPLH